MSLLEIDRLTAGFETPAGPVPVVHEVSLAVDAGQTVALVGESGSGKSVTARSVLRLLPANGRIFGGGIRFSGRDLLTLEEPAMRQVRGGGIGMVFQEPGTALSPVFAVGDQIAETLVAHGLADWTAARRRAVELLDSVRLPDAGRRAHEFPHQFSGGQQQRIQIAIALACRPSLLIADEPTTALDVTVQAEILDLLRELSAGYGLALLLITHDLGVVAEMAERVAVMYAGRIVENAPAPDLFRLPAHPYTRALLASIPRPTGGRRLETIEGAVPQPGRLPPGCAFEPRCPSRVEACRAAVPRVTTLPGDRTVRCVLHEGAAR